MKKLKYLKTILKEALTNLWLKPAWNYLSQPKYWPFREWKFDLNGLKFVSTAQKLIFKLHGLSISPTSDLVFCLHFLSYRFKIHSFSFFMLLLRNLIDTLYRIFHKAIFMNWISNLIISQQNLYFIVLKSLLSFGECRLKFHLCSKNHMKFSNVYSTFSINLNFRLHPFIHKYIFQ